MKLIELHFEWKREGILPNCLGLCYSIPRGRYRQTLSRFVPLDLPGWEYEYSYWARLSTDPDSIYESYNSLREIIVLFICAIHGEI